MIEELDYSLKKIHDAFKRLQEGADQAYDELSKDGVIQRFEFTFEVLWKTIKKFLEYKGIEARTPKDCFKEAFTIGLIDDESLVLNMLQDRNTTSHIYDKKTSEEIFDRIKTLYVPAIDQLISSLKKME